MKILSVVIENFLTIGSAELSLDSKGLVLVQGSNLDDDSAVSNGAGKSSIPDAICWALYGTTARGVTGDDVINNVAKKDCMVSVLIEEDTGRYLIKRHRKHATGKNAVLIEKDSMLDLSKGTDKESQEVINAIMGCDLDVFTSSVYAAQEMMPNLPGMTDKNLKQLIEASSGTERLAKAHEVAKALALDEARKEQLFQVGVVNADVRVKNAKDSISHLEGSFKDHEISKADEIKNLIDSINIGISEAQLMKKNLDSLNEADWVAKEASLQTEISTHSKYDIELKRLQKIEAVLTSDLLAESRRLKDLGALHQVRLDELNSVGATVGKPCPSCGKPYCEEDLEDVKKARAESVDNASAAISNQKMVVSKLDKEVSDAQNAVKSYAATIPDITALTNEYKDAMDAISFIKGEKVKLKAALTAVKATKEQLDKLQKEENPFTATLKKWKSDLASFEKEADDARQALLDASKKLEIAKSVVKVLGPAGVRARILDTVTPYLNARTSDYLGALSDGNISAVWTTIQRTKSGELREKFGIDVTNDKGAKMFSGLSGGEKRKVRLACALALQDLVSSRATKSINLFIGDEIDDALDSAGLERLMGILEAKARERGTVLVISHENLSDWIDDVATVEKSGGVSTVTGVLCK